MATVEIHSAVLLLIQVLLTAAGTSLKRSTDASARQMNNTANPTFCVGVGKAARLAPTYPWRYEPPKAINMVVRAMFMGLTFGLEFAIRVAPY